MLLTTLQVMFTRVFSRECLLQWARETGACQRLRRIHPADFVLSLVACALGDETRSIATARRMFYEISGFMPEESSFFDRFTDQTVALLRGLYHRALDAATEQGRLPLAELFDGTGIIDMQAIDASQVGLPPGSKEDYPATMDDRGGLKLTCTLGVLYQRIRDIVITDARQHDSRVMRLPAALQGLLLLLDQGYASVHRFWTIDWRGGTFITPLHTGWVGTIKAVRSGLGQCHVGKPLDDDRPYRGIVDLDVAFRRTKAHKVTLWVIVVTGYKRQPDGSKIMVDLWLLTNLSPEHFSPDDVATLYRYRWEIEQLFRVLKTVGRLDQLRSSEPEVFLSFLYATLLGVVLAHDICAQMRRANPESEPSIHRVTALVLGALPRLLSSLGTPQELPGLYEAVGIDRDKVFEVIDWSHAVGTLHDIAKACRWNETRRKKVGQGRQGRPVCRSHRRGAVLHQAARQRAAGQGHPVARRLLRPQPQQDAVPRPQGPGPAPGQRHRRERNPPGHQPQDQEPR